MSNMKCQLQNTDTEHIHPLIDEYHTQKENTPAHRQSVTTDKSQPQSNGSKQIRKNSVVSSDSYVVINQETHNNIEADDLDQTALPKKGSIRRTKVKNTRHQLRHGHICKNALGKSRNLNRTQISKQRMQKHQEGSSFRYNKFLEENSKRRNYSKSEIKFNQKHRKLKAAAYQQKNQGFQAGCEVQSHKHPISSDLEQCQMKQKIQKLIENAQANKEKIKKALTKISQSKEFNEIDEKADGSFDRKGNGNRDAKGDLPKNYSQKKYEKGKNQKVKTQNNEGTQKGNGQYQGKNIRYYKYGLGQGYLQKKRKKLKTEHVSDSSYQCTQRSGRQQTEIFKLIFKHKISNNNVHGNNDNDPNSLSNKLNSSKYRPPPKGSKFHSWLSSNPSGGMFKLARQANNCSKEGISMKKNKSQPQSQNKNPSLLPTPKIKLRWPPIDSDNVNQSQSDHSHQIESPRSHFNLGSGRSMNKGVPKIKSNYNVLDYSNAGNTYQDSRRVETQGDNNSRNYNNNHGQQQSECNSESNNQYFAERISQLDKEKVIKKIKRSEEVPQRQKTSSDLSFQSQKKTATFFSKNNEQQRQRLRLYSQEYSLNLQINNSSQSSLNRHVVSKERIVSQQAKAKLNISKKISIKDYVAHSVENQQSQQQKQQQQLKKKHTTNIHDKQFQDNRKSSKNITKAQNAQNPIENFQKMAKPTTIQMSDIELLSVASNSIQSQIESQPQDQQHVPKIEQNIPSFTCIVGNEINKGINQSNDNERKNRQNDDNDKQQKYLVKAGKKLDSKEEDKINQQKQQQQQISPSAKPPQLQTRKKSSIRILQEKQTLIQYDNEKMQLTDDVNKNDAKPNKSIVVVEQIVASPNRQSNQQQKLGTAKKSKIKKVKDERGSKTVLKQPENVRKIEVSHSHKQKDPGGKKEEQANNVNFYDKARAKKKPKDEQKETDQLNLFSFSVDDKSKNKDYALATLGQNTKSINEFQEEFLKLKDTIDMVTCTGQVASYCSDLLSKHQNQQWLIPSLFLYNYCCQYNLMHLNKFKQALYLHLISKQQFDDYKVEGQTLLRNNRKIINKCKKKQRLTPQMQQYLETIKYSSQSPTEQSQAERRQKYRTYCTVIFDHMRMYSQYLQRQEQGKLKKLDSQQLLVELTCGIRIIIGFLTLIKVELDIENLIVIPHIQFEGLQLQRSKKLVNKMYRFVSKIYEKIIVSQE